jgi:hypothetical protein
LRKGARRVAPDIARKLIEHNDFRQTPSGRRPPAKQLTARARLQRGPKALRDQDVQGRVFGEMLLLGEFGEPEVEDGVGLHFSEPFTYQDRH